MKYIVSGTSEQLRMRPRWRRSKYRAGGIGIYSQEDTQSGNIGISEPLPPDLRQTNSVAALWGGVAGSEKSTGGYNGHFVGRGLSDVGGAGIGSIMV